MGLQEWCMVFSELRTKIDAAQVGHALAKLFSKLAYEWRVVRVACDDCGDMT